MQLGLGVFAPATGARTDVIVRAPDHSALADITTQLLAAVLPDSTTGTVSAGGIVVPPSALLGLPPLVEGVLLEVDAAPSVTSLPGLPELRVVGGPGAGGIHLLAPGAVVVGRLGGVAVDDPDVSREHCRLVVGHHGATVEDLGSTNGTWVDGRRVEGTAALAYDGLLRVGDSTLQLVPSAGPPAPVSPTGDGHLAFNRPPRWRPAAELVQVVVPTPPEERERHPIPVLAAAVPLVIGLVMWRVLGNATFLLFTLLSPVMVIGNVVTERRSGRRRSRKQRALWAAQADIALRTLDEAVRADEQLRRAAAPDPATLLLTALGPRPRLWERRRTDDDLLDLRLGLADQPARVQAEGDVTPSVTTALSVPAVISLASAGVLGLAGPRNRTQAIGRWLLTQTAVLHSPRDVQVVVIADPAGAAAWEWVVRLPHSRPAGFQDCRATVGFGTDQAAARVAELAALVESRRAEQRAGAATLTAGRRVLLLVDGARALRAVPGLAGLLAEGPAVGVLTVALEQDARLLPEECGATAVVTGPNGTRLDIRVVGQADLSEVVADGVSPSYADAVARALAPLRDDSRERGGAEGLPVSVRWTELTGLPLSGGEEDVAAVVTRWAASGRTTSALLGRGPDGPFTVDLARHGPHALVAGTTGSGKSELLQTLIASLAVGNRPDELNVLLVDFKGGAAFGPCARLPHIVGMVTDLDGALVERALASLTAELRRREAVLAAAGAKDLDQLRRTRSEPLPRLVIVVDEFATLAEQLPEFVGGLVGIAQRGRSLGVHLVLATQRPEGVVSADIRANTNLRLCLAVTRDSESRDVIDSPVAATISRTTPGRAYARTGHADLTPFQTARVGGRRPAVLAAPQAPTVTLVPAAELGDPVHPGSRTEGREEATDLSLLVDACRRAAKRCAIPPPRSPWLPPLPELLTLTDLPATQDPLAGRPGRVAPIAFGLCDVPDSQSRRPLALDLDTATHLMVLGSPRSGRTTALRTFAGALAQTASADDVHLYVLDPGGGGLGGLAALPHTGAVVGRDDPERLERVLAWLTSEVSRRQALLGAAGHAGLAEQRAAADPADRLSHLVLLLDRWESFVATYQDLDAGRLTDLVHQLLREGPAAGLHVVMTADRTGLIGRVSSMIQDRVVLRLADRGDYAGAGLPTRLVPQELPAGRGWSMAGAPLVAQVALLDTDPSGPAQAMALARLAGRAASITPPRRVESLPSSVTLEAVPGAVVLGIGGDQLDPLTIDLADGFVIAGPPGSGRSTALLTIARQLHGMRVVAIAPRPSPLRALAGCHTDREASYDLEALLSTRPDAVLVDDAELLVDSPLAVLLERVVRDMRDSGTVVVAAGTTDELLTGYRGFLVDLRRARAGLLLSPQSAADGDLLNVRLSRAIGSGIHAGRGVLCRRGTTTPIQVAVASS